MSKGSRFQSSLTERYVRRKSSSNGGKSPAINSNEILSTLNDHPVDVTENKVSNMKIKSLGGDVKIITELLARKSKTFELVSWKKFCKRWKERAPVYFHFNILCLENKNHYVGWAMCNLVHGGACLINNGIKIST